ncbi:alpha/beta hydrolase [Flavobacterium sp. UBA6135]|uniref:alpha/beta hydrolase n=1 Tax=Flavobacterium sp. UBA6135 TaxID=1946553 RepID=UPI0025C5D9A6|nr:alpha/beta hydrolase-fold protein [Flavobacterium sp. UBA6135]
MKNKILLLLLVSFSSLFGQEVKVASGKIERIKNFKSKYVSERNIDVWLPDNYSTKNSYAVLYMHDGQMLFDDTTTWNKQEWGVDEAIGSLINEGSIKDVIVVGIWNTSNRHAEYFPQKPFENLNPEELEIVNQNLRENNRIENDLKPISDNYLKFIVTELKPIIDSKYKTLKDKDNTFIAGSSMGGLISLYAICEYPEVFGAAACISTHWPGIFGMENNPVPQAFFTYLESSLPDPNENRIYFDYGTATLDALYPPLQKKVDEIMLSNNFTTESWITLEFEGADHSESAWRERLIHPFTFLLRK